MQERRRIARQSCDLSGRMYVPRDPNPVRCQIKDISTHGAFIEPEVKTNFAPAFDLIIGDGIKFRPCRLARRTATGIGVEFLDTVRGEIEDILIEHAFMREIAFEAVAGLREENSTTWARMQSTTNAVVAYIEERNTRAWLRERAEGMPPAVVCPP